MSIFFKCNICCQISGLNISRLHSILPLSEIIRPQKTQAYDNFALSPDRRQTPTDNNHEPQNKINCKRNFPFGSRYQCKRADCEGKSDGHSRRERHIVGVTEEGKTLSALELPKTSEGLPVRILVKNALSGCDKLTDLTIRENITLLEDGCLAGAPQLVRIHMRRETCDELEAGPNLFEGSPSGLFVYLYSDTSYFNFTSGYWWSVHSSRLKRAN